MKDTISQAAKLASTYSVTYNPGFPLTFGYRPITVSNKCLGSMGADTPKGTNIYKQERFTTANSFVTRDNLNARHIFDLFSGKPGYHTDFTGLLIVAFFQNDPSAWYNLFNSEHTQLPYSVVLNMIVGVSRPDATRFINCSIDLFANTTPYVECLTQDLTIPTQVDILRSLLEF